MSIHTLSGFDRPAHAAAPELKWVPKLGLLCSFTNPCSPKVVDCHSSKPLCEVEIFGVVSSQSEGAAVQHRRMFGFEMRDRQS